MKALFTSRIAHRFSTLFSISLLVLIVGIAFVAGKMTHRVAVQPHTPVFLQDTQIAQVGSAPVAGSNRLQRSGSDKRSNSALDKRVQSAASTFEQVHDLVRREYVDSLPSEKIMSRGVIQSMLSSLEDQQSFYLTPEQKTILQAERNGVFSGIGATTAVRSGKTPAGYTELRLYIVAALPGSPAARAGLQTGDRITYFDGRYILSDNPYLAPNKIPHAAKAQSSAESHDEIHDAIGLIAAQMALREGKTGKHTLAIERVGVSRPIAVSLTMSETSVPDTSAQIKTVAGKSVLYLKVPAFTDRARSVVLDALRHDSSIGSIVLDLRQNVGTGSLKVAEAIGQRLAPASEGFAQHIGPAGKRKWIISGDITATMPKLRMTVITDRATAGSAEALAVCLADNGATLMGNGRTWGNGETQVMYPLPDGSAFTLTTGRLISPKGTGWDRIGLAPTVLYKDGLSESDTIAQAAQVGGIMTIAQEKPLPLRQEAAR